ncbi:MAG: glutamate formimidoyltransferase [Nitrospirae bacterium RIFCSPLOWO2_02_FULL_62_14]|nr:MAG: glutamate formimidoyltransferase [Nitrospirae bacterium RIFCSPLOWO2_02_FULL_62_14]
MSNHIVECVPNFSEGRDAATVRALIEAVRAVPGVALLDHTMDPDHDRAVLTFAGAPEPVAEAAFQAAKTATALIDLRRHQGVHPRVGATDVIPFVPIRGVAMRDCVELAGAVGRRIGGELKIPVFLYEQAATRPDHARLETIRLGGPAGLAHRMETNPEWTPDFGPPRLHPTAGATVIGARRILVAFNVNLGTNDLGIAKAIAKAVRQSSGGLAHVKAIGVLLASRKHVQVAMNLVNIDETPVHVAFEAVRREAGRRGVQVAGSELIGLVPRQAVAQARTAGIQIDSFDPSQILETRLEQAGFGEV